MFETSVSLETSAEIELANSEVCKSLIFQGNPGRNCTNGCTKTRPFICLSQILVFTGINTTNKGKLMRNEV